MSHLAHEVNGGVSGSSSSSDGMKFGGDISYSDEIKQEDDEDREHHFDVELDDLEVEDYLTYEHSQRGSWMRRWADRLGLGRRRQEMLSGRYARPAKTGHHQLRDGEDTQIQLRSETKMARTLRAVFNYPEPEMKLRSTAWLDGLRGLAAFEVFIFHYNHDWVDEGLNWGDDQYSDPAWWRAPFIRTFYASGSAAVCTFFAISGYVLSHRILSLYQQGRHDEAFKSLSSAVFRRAIRLYAPVILLSCILMLICRIFPNAPKATGYEANPTFFGEISNWITTMVYMIPPVRYPDRWYQLIDPYAGGVSWTIPLEYYGSIVIFVALLFIAQISSYYTRSALLFLMVAQSFVKDDWTAGQFLLGMMFADYQLQPARSSTPSRRSTTIKETVCFLLFLFGFYLAGIPGVHEDVIPPGSPPDYFPLLSRPGFDWIVAPLDWLGLYRDRSVDRYLECLAGIAAVIGIGESTILRRILERRPIQYLGRISFGLYLCHVPMRAWLNHLDKYYLLLFGLDPTIPLADRPDSWWYFAAYIPRMIPVLIINLILAGAFERAVDRPSVNFGRAFEKYCQARGGGSGVRGSAAYTPLPQHQDQGQNRDGAAYQMMEMPERSLEMQESGLAHAATSPVDEHEEEEVQPRASTTAVRISGEGLVLQ